MELPKRPRGDEFTPPGRLPSLLSKLAARPETRELSALIMYAFDPRTRLLPFLFADKRIVPAGPRMVTDTLWAAGLRKMRVAFQLWCPNVKPSQSKIDGKVPDLLIISSMQIHARKAYDLVEDAMRIPESKRPLVLVGGPKAIYEPWDLFAQGEGGRVNADVAVTGEAFVLIELLDRLLDHKSKGGSIRDAFIRAREADALRDIPGLVYRVDPPGGQEAHLVDTGVQRLVQDLDEYPMPVAGYSLLEPKHKREDLGSAPLPVEQVHKHAKIGSLTITQGCKFRCHYCPIPAYNQNSFRFKSAERFGDELTYLNETYGLRNFFGTDDNFFNKRETAVELFQHLAKRRHKGMRLHKSVRWGTESTEFDAHKNIDLLPVARQAGLRAIWFGLEDITAELIKKGQTPQKTTELFAAMNNNGICPMPMMMHHDEQPLYTRGSLYGIMNQVHFLRRAGAISVQITVLTPAVGTNFFDQPYEQGMVFDTVGGKKVEEWQFDGNHVVATTEKSPWWKQFNLIAAYGTFYNPFNLIDSMVRFKKRLAGADMGYQCIGMAALAKTAWDSLKWGLRLKLGPIEHCNRVPGARLKMVKANPDEVEGRRTGLAPPTSKSLKTLPLEQQAQMLAEQEGNHRIPLPVVAAG